MFYIYLFQLDSPQVFNIEEDNKYNIRSIKMQNHLKQKKFSNKFEKKQFLGQGTFGSVYKARDKNSGNIYAAKFIPLTGMTQKQIIKADQQRLIHSQLSHPNIIRFCESYMQNSTLIFVMEYCQYGDLQFYIKKRNSSQKLPQQVVMNIFIQILHAVYYLHSHHVIHRDIKPSNIFVNLEGAVKIADFGISKVLDQTQTINLSYSGSENSSPKLTGTPMYSSPQVCRNQEPSFKSDVWSMGCLLYQLCCLKPAFEASNILALATKINNEQVSNIDKMYSDDLNALIHWMLQKSADKRPRVSEILQLSFIKKYIKLFQLQQSNYQTPKKLSISHTKSSNSTQQSRSPDRSPYQHLRLKERSQKNFTIIYSEEELNEEMETEKSKLQHKQQNQVEQYYSKLKESCKNLLGSKYYEQMYHQILEIKNRLMIGKEKQKLSHQLKQIYGKQYFQLASAVLELVQHNMQKQGTRLQSQPQQILEEIEQVI